MNLNFLHAIAIHALIGIAFAVFYTKSMERYRKDFFSFPYDTKAFRNVHFVCSMIFYPIYIFYDFRFIIWSIKQPIKERIVLFVVKRKLRKIMKQILKDDPENEEIKQQLKNLK